MSTVWNSPQAAEVPRVAEDAHSLQERKGWCTIYTAVMAKPTRTMAPGQPGKKNGVGFMQNKKSERKIAFVA